jgi:hypothetical protein
MAAGGAAAFYTRRASPPWATSHLRRAGTGQLAAPCWWSPKGAISFAAEDRSANRADSRYVAEEHSGTAA